MGEEGVSNYHKSEREYDFGLAGLLLHTSSRPMNCHHGVGERSFFVKLHSLHSLH